MKTWVRRGAVAAVFAATAGVSVVIPAGASGALTPGRYIVRAADEAVAAGAVRAAGGTVLSPLPVIDGVDAKLDAAAVQALSADHAVALTADVTMQPLGQSYAPSALAPQLTRMDVGSRWTPGAGTGVGVALIDTGVADTPGIDPSHLVRSPDFSGSGNPYDGYGHGTFMAGLIAGNGAGGSGAVPGVAPGATLVAVKVAGNDGSTTMAQVIMGIGWAIANRDNYNIKVMSLSFGANLNLPAPANPLDQAVEAAWSSGIAVVASAGNGGTGQVSSPGDDPAVISVGAETTVGAVQSPSWSGNSTTKPDVVAPGVSVVSLRDPGSVIDVQNPSARIGDSYFVGTGTSMSTALTAGAAALMVADHPGATPDQIKAALVATSGPDLSGPAGPVDVAAADSPATWSDPGLLPPGTGHGPGNGNGRAGSSWIPAGFTPWNLAPWNSVRWDSVRWDSVRWDSVRWDSVRWDSVRWDSVRWDSVRWDGSAWTVEAWGQ